MKRSPTPPQLRQHRAVGGAGSCRHCGAQLALGAVACFRCGHILEVDSAHPTTGVGALQTQLETLAKAGLLEGQWRLLEPIGHGGSGVVFAAHDVTFNRKVAVKVLHEELAKDPAQVARFERKGRLLAAINHPNLSMVLGSGRRENRPFVVLRLLSGRTAAELLHSRGGTLPLSEVAACLLPVCDALQALHDAGVVHHVLKPSKVFIGDDGRVTLLGHGDVSAASSDATRARERVGSVEYLSPEQLRGGSVDARSDIYSLGCLMYELLTGHPPFTADATVLTSLISGARPDLHAISTAVAPLVHLMLEVAPDARPSLADVRARLLQHAVSPPAPTVKVVLAPELTRIAPRSSASLTVVAPPLSNVEERSAAAPTKKMTPPPLARAPFGEPAPATRGLQALAPALAGIELSGRAKAGIVLAASALVGMVGVGVMQTPPSPVAPVRVDRPAVGVQVKIDPPPQSAPPGPPPEALPVSVSPKVAHLDERKDQAYQALPLRIAPKRGRAPNLHPPRKGYLRIVTTVFGDEVSCPLWVDGRRVGTTPYLAGILRPGEHTIKAACLGWPVSEEIWPIPPEKYQRQGEVIEVVIAAAEATRPIRGEDAPQGYSVSCMEGSRRCIH